MKALETATSCVNCCCSSHRDCQDVTGTHCCVCLISQSHNLKSMELSSSMKLRSFPRARGPPTFPFSFHWTESLISETYGLTFPPFPWWSRSQFSQWSLYSFSRYSLATKGTGSACAVGPLAAQSGEAVCTVHFAHTTGKGNTGRITRSLLLFNTWEAWAWNTQLFHVVTIWCHWELAREASKTQPRLCLWKSLLMCL